jgi:hypothetical protein
MDPTYAASLSFDILDKWKLNDTCSTIFEKPGNVIVFLIVFSVLVCPGGSNHL